MKKSHIIALLIIAVAVGVIISTTGNASSYVTFDEAWQVSSGGNTKSLHVVGELKRDANGEVTGLEKSPDNLSFTFLMVDESKKEQLVYHNEPLPPDLIRSEKVVVIGHYEKDFFLAEKILLKCPSKYQDNSLKTTAGNPEI